MTGTFGPRGSMGLGGATPLELFYDPVMDFELSMISCLGRDSMKDLVNMLYMAYVALRSAARHVWIPREYYTAIILKKALRIPQINLSKLQHGRCTKPGTMAHQETWHAQSPKSFVSVSRSYLFE